MIHLKETLNIVETRLSEAFFLLWTNAYLCFRSIKQDSSQVFVGKIL